MQSIQPSPRVVASAFYDSTIADGVKSFTTYNGMLLPTGFGDPEGEYWRLLKGVSMWDVGCERQVQLKGADAPILAQMLTTRNLDSLRVGQGRYAPICNHNGILLNDPVINKLADDLYWISIADSNIWFWASAIAAERELNVEVTEPDASPLAVQGPLAENVVANLLGDWVRDLKYFHFKEIQVEGIPLLVARSGYSKQGGFELYLCDESKGAQLWNLVRESGKAWDIGPGTPNAAERIESGLLSFGTDTDAWTNPFEVRLGQYVDLELPDTVIGISALRQIKDQGIKRHQVGVIIDAQLGHGLGRSWIALFHNGAKVGAATSTAFSWRVGSTVGLALVDSIIEPGDQVEVKIESRALTARIVELPFF